MHAKRIIAPDMRRALKIVREQLGENAVILQNRTIAEGVELIATSEQFGDLVAQHPSGSKQISAQPTQSVESQWQPEPEQADKKSAPSKGKLIRGRVRHLGKLEKFIKTEKNPSAKEPSPSNEPPMQGKTQQFAQMLNQASQQLDNHSVDSADRAELPDVSVLGQSAADRYGLKQLPPRPLVKENETKKKSQEPSTPQNPVASQSIEEKDAAREGFELAISGLREEVHMLRSLLASQTAQQQWEQYQFAEPMRALLLNKLVGIGFAPGLARHFVSELALDGNLRQAWHALLSLIFNRLPILEPGLFASSDALVLLGPTGAGKTATISKIAAAYVLETGQKDLAIISTDCYRMGALDELGRLSQILNVPMHSVSEATELERLLTSYSGRRKVLIDTAGLVASDPAWSAQCNTLLAAKQNVRHFLVLSSTHQLSVHQKSLAEYAQLPLHGCVISKLDECAALAQSLSAVIEAQLPVAYVTTGLKLPEDLQMADRIALIKQAFTGVEQAQAAAAEMFQCFNPCAKDNAQSLLSQQGASAADCC